MFILCPHCQFLVAIEPATGLPPERCPRCGKGLGTEAPAPAALDAAPPADAAREVPSEPPPSREPVDADAVAEAIVQAHADVEIAVVTPTESDVLFDDVLFDDVAPMIEPAPASGSVPDPAPEPAPTPARARAMPSPPKADDVAPSSPARPKRATAPSFARDPATASMPTRRWSTAAILAGLALLLVLQLLVADRARLATDARWRPALATLCTALRCTLPMWHEPEAFTLVARDVRPSRPGVLHVAATFRNDARWAQAWPALHLALQDVDGRTIGARVFAPTEYLGGRQTQNGIAPGQVASVAFDVGEPPGTVVAFTFDFR